MPVSSLSFYDQRAFVGSLQQSRFHLFSDFAGGGFFPMIYDAPDPLADPVNIVGQNQFVVLKDITARVMFPTCVESPNTIPVQASDTLLALFQEFTFRIRVNDMVQWFPVTFVRNADEYKSQGLLARFDFAVKSLTVDVRRDYIDGALANAGWIEYLTLGLEFLTFYQ